MGRAVVLVMDSFGIGATDDAGKFGDEGANTLGSIARERAATRKVVTFWPDEVKRTSGSAPK